MSEYITDTKIVELRKSRTTISATQEFAWQDGASDIRDIYEAELTKLRSERDELVGALEEIVYQADEGMPIIDVSPCIVKASKLLAKHKPE